MEADNVSHLQHEDRERLQVLHELVERSSRQPVFRASGAYRAAVGLGAAMSEVLLNDPQIDACLQQMGRVGMAQRVNVGGFEMPGTFKAARNAEPKAELSRGARPGLGEGKHPFPRAMSPPLFPQQLQVRAVAGHTGLCFPYHGSAASCGRYRYRRSKMSASTSESHRNKWSSNRSDKERPEPRPKADVLPHGSARPAACIVWPDAPIPALATAAEVSFRRRI